MAGVRGVRRMRLIALLTACVAALALALPAGAAVASGGDQPAAPAAPSRRRRSSGRPTGTGAGVCDTTACTWAATCSRTATPWAADEQSAAGSKRALRHSIHRMQRRWGNWLRHDPRGRTVAFKLKVRRPVPAWGRSQLRSIAWCESKNDPHAIGGGGAYRGMYQFSFSTWAVVGGSGDPAAASRWEQTWRAWLLLSRHGGGHWPICG